MENGKCRFLHCTVIIFDGMELFSKLKLHYKHNNFISDQINNYGRKMKRKDFLAIEGVLAIFKVEY